MVRARFGTICLVAVVLAATGCGGGGGSGGGALPPPSSPQPAPSPDPDPDPAPDPDPSPDPEPDPDPDPVPDPDPQPGASSATVLFPWGRSAATADTVTVRGTASDADGVSQVLINGVPATLSQVASTSSRHGLVRASAADDEVSFSAEVALQPGENEVSVDVEDALGEVSKKVHSVAIEYVEVPVPFDMDEERLRLAGLGFAPFDPSAVVKLVVHDYVTGEQTVYPQPFSGVSGFCLKGDVDAFLYLQRTDESYDLRRFDLVGLHDSRVVSIPPNLLDPGADYQPEAHTASLDCGSGDGNAYALFNFARENEWLSKSRILRIGIDSGAIDVFAETDPDESPPWVAFYTALTADTLITKRSSNVDAPLTSVDLATGARMTLTPFDVDGDAIAPALQQQKIYVARSGGVDEIDLSGPPSTRNISAAQSTDPFVFSQVRSAAYDAARDRVIVGDSDLDMLVAVDASTGERSSLLARSVGHGVRMIAPRRIAVSQDMTTAYVADDGGGTAEKLFAVDLATGDRHVIGDIDHAANVVVSGLAVDEEARLAYVGLQDSVLQVHLDSGAVTVLAGPAVAGSLLEAVSDLILDRDNQRLLVADASLAAIVALDLVSREQTIFSRAGEAGAGPGFQGINSLTRLPATGELYATDQLGESVVRIDPATGDRHVALDACLDDSSDVLGTNQSLQQILPRQATGELLILGDNLLSFDPQTSACRVVRSFVNPAVLRIEITPDDRVLGAAFGALVQYDPESGEAVIVSK